MVVAIIPARGGSKRLPGKNLRSFAGRPLIAYSIVLARNVAEIDRCVVSTDDDHIADVARAYGAEVLRRPPELATDEATTASAVKHALAQIVSNGTVPRIAVTLQPTNPLRTIPLVEEGLSVFHAVRPDSVVSVAPAPNKTGTVREGMYLPDYRPGTRSQDLAERFHETGQLYVTDAKLILDTGDLFGTRMAALLTDLRFASADIDTAEDFAQAELLYARHRDCFPYMEAVPTEAAHA